MPAQVYGITCTYECLYEEKVAYRCRILLCRRPMGSKTDMIVGCQDVQHVPVRYSMEGSLGGLTKNNMSVKGQKVVKV